MIRYFQRSVKYFIALCLLYFVMLYIMSFTSLMVATPGESLTSILSSVRGIRMAVAMVVLSLAYPFFGFMKRTLTGNLLINRQIIVSTMMARGFALREERDGKMIFGADNLFRRITLLFEDYIVMTQVGDDSFEISGNRKSVAYIIFRLEFAIEKSRTGGLSDDLDE